MDELNPKTRTATIEVFKKTDVTTSVDILKYFSEHVTEKMKFLQCF